MPEIILQEEINGVRSTVEFYDDGTMGLRQWDVWLDPLTEGYRGPNDRVVLSADVAAKLAVAILERGVWHCEGCGEQPVERNRDGGHTIEGSMPDNCGPLMWVPRA